MYDEVYTRASIVSQSKQASKQGCMNHVHRRSSWPSLPWVTSAPCRGLQWHIAR